MVERTVDFEPGEDEQNGSKEFIGEDWREVYQADPDQVSTWTGLEIAEILHSGLVFRRGRLYLEHRVCIPTAKMSVMIRTGHA